MENNEPFRFSEIQYVINLFADSSRMRSRGKKTEALKVNKNLFTPDVIIFPTMFVINSHRCP